MSIQGKARGILHKGVLVLWWRPIDLPDTFDPYRLLQLTTWQRSADACRYNSGTATRAVPTLNLNLVLTATSSLTSSVGADARRHLDGAIGGSSSL